MTQEQQDNRVNTVLSNIEEALARFTTRIDRVQENFDSADARLVEVKTKLEEVSVFVASKK